MRARLKSCGFFSFPLVKTICTQKRHVVTNWTPWTVPWCFDARWVLWWKCFLPAISESNAVAPCQVAQAIHSWPRFQFYCHIKSGKRRSIKSAGILQAARPVEATDRHWLHWHDLTTDSLSWDPWAIDHPSGPQLRVSLSDLRRPYIYPPALIAEHLNAPRPPLFVHLSSTDVCCLLSHFSQQWSNTTGTL